MPKLPFPIIDTHQHLWDRQKLNLPWLKDVGPPLAEDHTLADYRAATEGLPIEQAIYMEVDVAAGDKQKEAQHVLGLIDKGEGPTRAAILSADPGALDARAFIDQFRDDARVKGFRQVLHGAKPAAYCLGTKFVENCRYLGEIGKTFDLCLRPGELADAARLAKLCPQTTFILDHCGNADPKAFLPQGDPRRGKPEHTAEAWQAALNEVAQHTNVICKISGIVARAPQEWTANDLRPIVEACAQAFGENRLVFGSDWPVCKLGASLKQWTLALGEIVAPWSEKRQEKLWNRNAKWVYKL